MKYEAVTHFEIRIDLSQYRTKGLKKSIIGYFINYLTIRERFVTILNLKKTEVDLAHLQSIQLSNWKFITSLNLGMNRITTKGALILSKMELPYLK